MTYVIEIHNGMIARIESDVIQEIWRFPPDFLLSILFDKPENQRS